jgi:DNA-binding transcriptional MerR regulator
MRTHSTQEVASLTGASVRQLDYWATSGLLKPSARDAAGKGSRRRYAFRDVVAAQAIQRLRAGNCPLQKIRNAVKYLNAHYPAESPAQLLAKLVLVTDGKSVYLLTDGDKVMEVMTRQAVLFWTIPIGKLILDTDARIQSTPTEWMEEVRVRARTYHLDVRRDDETGEFSVQCRELPGAIEQGRTATEAVSNGRDAIESVLAYMDRRGAGAQRVAAR